MFSEKSRLTDKRENPFYGSYKEYSNLEEAHWQNKKKKQQLTIVTVVVLVLVALAIGITLAITLPSILGREDLDPPNPLTYLGPSPSILGQYTEAGISTESEQCTEIGRKVLQDLSGSAVDAAVGAALCIGVVAPQSSGLGGGLFMTIYDPETGVHALNARETSPMLFSESEASDSGEVEGRTRQRGGAVGVPGELAGLYEAHKRFGKVTWAELVKFSSDLATNGFPVTYNLADSLKRRSSTIKSDPGLSSEFVNPATGEVYVEGEILKRPKLGATLSAVGSSGMEAFYNGTLAEMIEEELSALGSLVNRDDLAAYSVDWQDPVQFTMSNNLTMYGTSFPSGAPVVALALQILDGFGRQQPLNMSLVESALDAHRFAETLKFASVHRSQIGDPEFASDQMDDLLKKLVSAEYAAELRARIDPYKSYDNPEYYGGVFGEATDSGTAHISVIGPDGDACSLSTTINTGFGVGYMGTRTGIIYNDQLYDFSVENVTTVYGLPPNHYNFQQAGKRPASSMAPLIFLNEREQPVFVIGGAGGSKILPAVISTAWRALYREMDIKAAADHPRFTVSFDPSELLYEYGTPDPIVTDLERRGHATKRVEMDSFIGNVNSVCRTKRSQIILTNADYRKRGSSAGF